MPDRPMFRPPCLPGGAGLWLALGLLSLGGCSDKPAEAWSGYAEGDYVYVAAPLAGRLDSLSVQIGQNVVQGGPLFALDAENEAAALEESAARASAAQSQAANLDKGRRQDEIAVIDAQLAQAKASAVLAQADVQRQQQLVAQGFVSRARMDDASTALNQARARVDELSASRRVARLPARPDERASTQATAVAAKEVVRQSQWRAGQKQQLAPADALVSDVFFRVGEFIPAGQPVLALLPPQNIKARFFVPEAVLGTLRPGQPVWLACDGCGAPIAAKISRIATQAEYTPPVIYSNAQRARLVFMVEARPAPADATRLRPGQPLDVRAEKAAGKAP